MSPSDNGPAGHSPTVLGLWGVALVCVGLAVADTSLLGIEPPMLAMLATVCAATAASHHGDRSARC